MTKPTIKVAFKCDKCETEFTKVNPEYGIGGCSPSCTTWHTCTDQYPHFGATCPVCSRHVSTDYDDSMVDWSGTEEKAKNVLTNFDSWWGSLTKDTKMSPDVFELITTLAKESYLFGYTQGIYLSQGIDK
jgi:hypothetical protein